MCALALSPLPLGTNRYIRTKRLYQSRTCCALRSESRGSWEEFHSLIRLPRFACMHRANYRCPVHPTWKYGLGRVRCRQTLPLLLVVINCSLEHPTFLRFFLEDAKKFCASAKGFKGAFLHLKYLRNCICLCALGVTCNSS